MKNIHPYLNLTLFFKLLIALLMASAASAAENLKPELTGEDCSRFPSVVQKVTDGDTLVANIDLGFSVVLENSKVRLYGINTPESRTRNAEEKVAGLAAKDRLAALVQGSSGVELCVNRKKPRGKFGRVLAIVFVDGENVNQKLIDEGHAVPYFGGKREPWAPTPTKTPEKVADHSLDFFNLELIGYAW